MLRFAHGTVFHDHGILQGDPVERVVAVHEQQPLSTVKGYRCEERTVAVYGRGPKRQLKLRLKLPTGDNMRRPHLEAVKSGP